MKLSITAIFVLIATQFFGTVCLSQNTISRNINIHGITGDSVMLDLNEEYDMIEDSCAQIYRYIHFDGANKRFIGNFTDVSRFNQNIVVSEGRYNDQGLKDGRFITRYPDGTIRAKGSYKNNLFDGVWEFFYDDGKPRMTFEANGKNIKVINTWDSKGELLVNNGTGECRVIAILRNDGEATWSGKLVNSVPDGVWTFTVFTNGLVRVVNTEVFKDGQFKKGTSGRGSYKDMSRISFIPDDALPFLTAERMGVSNYLCQEVATTSRLKSNNNKDVLIDAHYRPNEESFRSALFNNIHDFLSTNIRKSPSTHTVSITAEIDERGKFTNIQGDPRSDTEFAAGFKSALYALPKLQPATVNGKPVRQKFTFTYSYEEHNSRYSIDYRFLPLK